MFAFQVIIAIGPPVLDSDDDDDDDYDQVDNNKCVKWGLDYWVGRPCNLTQCDCTT